MFFAFISAVAFATILAVVAGLTISASTSFAHDFFTNVIHHGKEHRPGEEVRVARITAFVVGALAIVIAIVLGPSVNVAFLVGLAFAVAASANLPVIIFSIFWKRFNTTGAVCGLGVGLALEHRAHPHQPGLHEGSRFSRSRIPASSASRSVSSAHFSVRCISREPAAEARFAELSVRANTGLGAEKAVAE